MISVTVKHGLSMTSKMVEDDATIGDLLSDRDLKAQLGFTDNVRAIINGTEMPRSARIPAGARVEVEAAVNQKALALR